MNDNSLRNARIHNNVVLIITIAGIAQIVVNFTQAWEFWMPPLMIMGLVAAWILHVMQYGSRRFRENYYLIYAMVVAFYHGVHATSFFDIAVVSALLMSSMALLGRKELLQLFLAEFLILMTIQVMIAVVDGEFVFDSLAISRIIFHVLSVILVHKVLQDAIRNNRRDLEELEHFKSDAEKAGEEMEDFLVNVSHELRTPVNVINGMSALILKKEERDDVVSIQDAGLRLSRQIEDIQDFSEIQRGDLKLEEEKYMITSLVNDIVSGYMDLKKQKGLELVVDLEPGVPAVLKGDAGKIRKVICHLLDNAVKYTARGGILLKIGCIRREYGINLNIEVTDTGIGISRAEVEKLSKGFYQANKKRNRSTGGIGLGLSIVYGFVRKMDGFVTIESAKGSGTSVHVCIAQEVLDPAPCIGLETDRHVSIAMFWVGSRHGNQTLRDFYRTMAMDFSAGLHISLYSASGVRELEKLLEREEITHVFMEEEEYRKAPEFFDQMSKGDVEVIVATESGFAAGKDSNVILMPMPLFGIPAARILNGETRLFRDADGKNEQLRLDGMHALVVDDEPMNLVVATGLFREYNMKIDTAGSGRESIEKFEKNPYDLVFMDHMMPEMDGVEAMKRIREVAKEQGRQVKIVALTANAISGAREMFLQEGFDGFISKPIHIHEFERTMRNVIPAPVREGGSV